MITRDDVKFEMEKAEKFMEDCKDSFQKVVVKLLTVILKVAMNIRTNTTLIMDKLEIKKIAPKKPGETQEKE
jgi:PBP1b-binding outer membrane lipoprotein LpoB